MAESRPLKILSSIKAIRTLTKLPELTFCTTLKINQSFQQSREYLFKKNGWTLIGTASFVEFQQFIFSSPFSSFAVSLKTNKLQLQWKPITWKPLKKANQIRNLFKTPFSAWLFPGRAYLKDCLYLLWLRTLPVWIAFLPRENCWKQSQTIVQHHDCLR